MTSNDTIDHMCLHCLIHTMVSDATRAVTASKRAIKQAAESCSDMPQIASKLNQLLPDLTEHEEDLDRSALALHEPTDPQLYN